MLLGDVPVAHPVHRSVLVAAAGAATHGHSLAGLGVPHDRSRARTGQ